MKIKTSQVTKLMLTELDALDPVTVIIEDFEKHRGKIIIECYGEAWAAFFGSMGCDSIVEFVLSCDADYLAEKLSDISPEIVDYDSISERISNHNINEGTLLMYSDEMDIAYGEGWQTCLPIMKNPRYEYLLRIVKTVKSGLREYYEN